MILGRIRNAVKVSPILVHLKQYVLGDVRQWSLSGDESSRLKKKQKTKKKQPPGIKSSMDLRTDVRIKPDNCQLSRVPLSIIFPYADNFF